ncbi:nuclease-related domain-containing protein [Sanguibacter sp. 25GB23B1]|uniref:nuclease-related domain-containing protein n=1 Tax=unclassified Sanguibacter TaxID=2645534 RepID=UPI0032AF2F66
MDDAESIGTDEVEVGVAGASAQREYARRSASREARIRREHPHIGGLLLALSDDPQSTRAWATGAVGEELLGARLDRATTSGVRVLHDRRIPRSRANIDHVVVGPAGVFVIDAKRYKGRPSRRIEGGLFRPRVEKLMVGSRNCSALLAGVHKQVDLVGSALADAGLDDVPVTGVLCFVQADWPLIGGAFQIEDLHILWPRRAVTLVQSPGPLSTDAIDRIHRRLAEAFPRA